MDGSCERAFGGGPSSWVDIDPRVHPLEQANSARVLPLSIGQMKVVVRDRTVRTSSPADLLDDVSRRHCFSLGVDHHAGGSAEWTIRDSASLGRMWATDDTCCR